MTTFKGRVVYDRDPHLFSVKDAVRIVKAVSELEEIQRLVEDLTGTPLDLRGKKFPEQTLFAAACAAVFVQYLTKKITPLAIIIAMLKMIVSSVMPSFTVGEIEEPSKEPQSGTQTIEVVPGYGT